MRIVFIHYHLKTGGVTSVIRQQAAVLQGAGYQALVLCGQSPPPDVHIPFAVIPGLAYDGLRDPDLSAREVAADIDSAIHAHWPQGADLVHVHNPTLAKNRLFQDILFLLQERGHRLLCQIHDFAEDGRPAAFFRQSYTADCHYAVLNKRDYDLLLASGLKPDGVHLLPNPVQALEDIPAPTSLVHGPVLYPVRAIRRKNVGEALLLSLFFKPGNPLFITLPPNSPQDILSYRDWRGFAGQHGLKVRFEVGLTHAFKSLVSDCCFILTTSVTEGFGYAFLEGWTGARVVWGRLLPGICRDFLDQGIRLDHFYPHLRIPLAWLDAEALSVRWQQVFIRSAKRLGIALTDDMAQNAWSQVTGKGMIDYGLLHEDFQKQVMVHLLQNPESRGELTAINGFLAHAPQSESRNLVAHNRRIIAKRFNLECYRKKLLQIYPRVVQIQVRHQLDKAKLASAFMAPHRFSLLKWASYDG